MLKNPYFYNGLYKKYIAIFGTLFNEIDIEREDKNNITVDKMRVPLEYAPKDKMLARLRADPEINKPAAIVLPRISFELTGMNYDADRMLSSTGYRCSVGSGVNSRNIVYNPVPYNLEFAVYIYAKFEEDAAKIVEQILPYFRPEFTINAKLIDGMENTTAIPITLNSVTRTDTYEGDLRERRQIIWELRFLMKTYFYGPTISKPLIKFVITTGYDSNANNPVASVTVQPGLTANGEPTTDPLLSIDPKLINKTDNWTVIEIVDNFLDLE